MKSFHQTIRINGLQRGLDNQLTQQGRLVDPPKTVVPHYPHHPVADKSVHPLNAGNWEEAPCHVLAEGDR